MEQIQVKDILNILKEIDTELYKVLKNKKDNKYDRIYDGWVKFIDGLLEYDRNFKWLFKQTKNDLFKCLARNDAHVNTMMKLNNRNTSMGLSDKSLTLFLAQVLTTTSFNRMFFSDEHIKNAPITKVIAPIIINLQQHFVMFNNYLKTHTDEEIEQDASKELI